jgi:hypothetical protein
MSQLHALAPALLCLSSLACGTPFDPAGAGTWSATNQGRAMHERAMSRGRARDVLADLDPATRATLDELMFIADLQMASGNESQPLRIYRRVQRELAEPRTVSPRLVATVLADMARVMEARPGVPESEHDPGGYELVQAMLLSPQGAFPSAGACLDRIAAQPDEVAVAFLVQEYFADDHYHEYWMQEAIFDLLVSGGYGPLPLMVVEDRLRDSWPYHSPESEWVQAVAAGRAILGDEFEAWYREVRGVSYARDWVAGYL